MARTSTANHFHAVAHAVDFKPVPTAALDDLGLRHVGIVIVVFLFLLPPLPAAVEFKDRVKIFETAKRPFELSLFNNCHNDRPR